MRISDWSSDVCSSDLRESLMSTKLKMQLDHLDGLDESLHGFYEERDGKFVLNLDGYEDPAALKRAKDHEKEARKKAEKDLKELREEFDQFKSDLENNNDEKSRKKGDVDALEQSYKDKIRTERNGGGKEGERK